MPEFDLGSSIHVRVTEVNPPEQWWLLTVIPEAWLDKWAPRYNRFVSLLVPVWTLLWLAYCVTNWTGHGAVLSVVLALGWAPFLMVDGFLMNLSTAHFYNRLRDHVTMLEVLHDQLGEALGQAVHEAMAMHDEEAGAVRPTIQ